MWGVHEADVVADDRRMSVDCMLNTLAYSFGLRVPSDRWGVYLMYQLAVGSDCSLYIEGRTFAFKYFDSMGRSSHR